jgi:carbonic anhydrase
MKRLVSAFASIAILPLLLFSLSCAGAPAAGSHGKVPGTDPCKPPFTYPELDSTGQNRWAALSSCSLTCANGSRQSPIDLAGAIFDANLPPLVFHYAPSATVSVTSDGHTIKATVPSGSRLAIGTTVYALEEFHFHWLSEHRLDGHQTPLEMHLVNKNSSGAAAVGVFILPDPRGVENPELAKLWQSLDDYGTRPIPVGNINIQELVPTDLASIRYDGSLTTPACDQPVSWNVLHTPIFASQGQIDRFQRRFPISNSRQPLKDLNGRRVVKDF